MNKIKYYLDLGAMEDCMKIITEEKKGIKMIVLFLGVGFTQIGWKKLLWMLVLTLLLWLKPTEKEYIGITLRS